MVIAGIAHRGDSMNAPSSAASGDEDGGPHSPSSDLPVPGYYRVPGYHSAVDDYDYYLLRAGYSTSDLWLDPVSYDGGAVPTTRWLSRDHFRHGAADVVPTFGMANVVRGFPPAWNGAASAITQRTGSAASAEGGFDAFAIDWTKVTLYLPRRQRRKIRPYRIFAAAAGRHRQKRVAVISPRRLTAAAVLLAGPKRSAVRDEWRSHLAGWTGCGLVQDEQIRAARGFLWSAVRYRLSDAVGLVGRGFDAVLRSRSMSNLAIWIPVLLAVLAIVRHEGLYGLITYDLNLIELGGGAYGAIRYGRCRRGVKPTKRKRSQVSR
jgi:hypothetical protein